MEGLARQKTLGVEDPLAPNKTMSDYQNLMEGKCEVMAVSKEDPETKINLTELLRNVYIKIYKLEQEVHKLSQPSQATQSTQTGSPP